MSKLTIITGGKKTDTTQSKHQSNSRKHLALQGEVYIQENNIDVSTNSFALIIGDNVRVLVESGEAVALVIGNNSSVLCSGGKAKAFAIGSGVSANAHGGSAVAIALGEGSHARADGGSAIDKALHKFGENDIQNLLNPIAEHCVRYDHAPPPHMTHGIIHHLREMITKVNSFEYKFNNFGKDS